MTTKNKAPFGAKPCTKASLINRALVKAKDKGVTAKEVADRCSVKRAIASAQLAHLATHRKDVTKIVFSRRLVRYFHVPQKKAA